MALQPSPLLIGFEQGADGTDSWNALAPGGARGPLTLDPQGVALGQQFQAIKAGIEAQQARPIWNPDNPVGTETVQSMGMPQPTTYAGAVGQFIAPATGRMTEQGAARMENPMLGVDTGGLGMIKAFHGSPHAFDAFSDHAIGTGEGAQAYGYGHYVAENEGVARGYRDVLGPRADPTFQKAAEELDAAWRDFDGSPEATARTQAAKVKMDEAHAAAPQGHMYEVNVAADPEKFLHWDRPLSEQHPDVQKFFRDQGFSDLRMQNPGSTAYGALSLDKNMKMTKAADVSAAMRDAGIPGIRYYDAGSRHLPDPTITPLGSNADGRSYWQVGSGPSKKIFRSEVAANDYVANAPAPTHNAVIFDPATMEIIRRYGLAGLMGGGAAALAGGGTQEQ